MRVLLATLGSHGDIHPFVAIGKALRARGHEAIILANPYYQPLIEGEGLGFAPLSEHADMEKLLRENAQIMDSWRGPMAVLKEFTLPLIPEMAKRTRESLQAFKPDLVLSHPLCYGVSWACEAAAVSCGIIGLSPITWFNRNDAIVMPAFRGPNPSLRAVAFDLWIGCVFTSLALDGPCNRIRREMGLQMQKAIVYTHSQGGIINLGMWSPQFRPALAGDPDTGVICGFPWFDRRAGVERETEDLMKFVDEGDPPIVFTMGTTMVHLAGQFFTKAAEACRELGRRGVLLVGRNEYFNSTSLPANVRAFAYAPYSTLLPKAAATVHHGGIGSTAQALRAGRPTVVIPAAHDQFDNAARVKRLGLSETVPVKRVTTKRLVAALRAVLDDPAFAARATSIGAKIAAEDGAGKAVSEIERASKAT
jgi:UDP:flavonoid glycosyltransferase YjiC (YdhE family)